jgi:hypothetical protein
MRKGGKGNDGEPLEKDKEADSRKKKRFGFGSLFGSGKGKKVSFLSIFWHRRWALA